jgi:enoyl-CoA hydratase/carnithine racemase
MITAIAGPLGAYRAQHLKLELAGAVATLKLDRPERKNPLTFQSYAELRDTFRELRDAEDVDVVVFLPNGGNFCSGGDVHDIIGALQRLGPRELLDFTRMTGAVVRGLRELPLPVVAAVNGVAAGAGAVIALAADLRLLARSASLQFLFTRVGLAGADMGCAYLLPRLVGLGRATELLLLGDRVDAEQAAALGLASRVVDDAELPAATAELAGRLAAGPAMAQSATKVLLGRELDLPLAGALELEAVTQALLLRSEDHAEFYAAFTEGRSPTWTGR